jgi:transposase-like protein
MEPTIQRWSAKRKVELLLELIRGEKKLVDVCREHDLKQSEVEGWMDTFVKAGERGLKANAEDEAAAHEKELKELRAKVGELVLELDARKNGRLSTAGTRQPSDVAERDAPGRQSGLDRTALPLVRDAAVELLLHDAAARAWDPRCRADDARSGNHR